MLLECKGFFPNKYVNQLIVVKISTQSNINCKIVTIRKGIIPDSITISHSIPKSRTASEAKDFQRKAKDLEPLRPRPRTQSVGLEEP